LALFHARKASIAKAPSSHTQSRQPVSRGKKKANHTPMPKPIRHFHARCSGALAWLSLVSCIIVAAIALRSYFIADSFYKESWNEAAQRMTSSIVVTNPGSLSIHLMTADHPWAEWRQSVGDGQWHESNDVAEFVPQGGHFWGDFYRSQSDSAGVSLHQWVLRIPFWPFVVLLAIHPAMKVRGFLNRRARFTR
jgi:hypothetical protein